MTDCHFAPDDGPVAHEASGFDEAVIPAALESRVLEALRPPSASAFASIDIATIRERLHRRIRATKAVTTVHAGDGQWMPFSPKVQIKVLRRDVDTQSYLLKLEPGAVLLPHVHGQDEECMVIEGQVRIGDLVVRQGDYHLAPKGVAHEPIRSESGAVLFLRGAIPSAAQVRWGRAAIHALTGR